ncbi:hypothetical protein K437DRAFT_274836 [Tilletiaria anomala UBC 951]|uniref:Zinc finger protein 830 n=1 Tax=Tilletiaria anomala (strain ATCC 24038 / CBS 436.72 / UBC 951) TaxID=1037660 RepID=A0A066VYP7_TILAU|nr:uncharacterized protein K437DRAFT_274836 [Tilletiaria anomala UBC 951]KDN43675.1 hypothetical protein K437DRAFT_274836 [Tilletiaria anomala UBC 951]
MDARALLRATKSGIGSGASGSSSHGAAPPAITDRFASYNRKTSALRCSACSYMTIKHENLWMSHAASKSHRSNAAGILAKERQAEEQQAQERRRREEEGAAAVADSSKTPTGKRKAESQDAPAADAESSSHGDGSKKQRMADPVIESEWEKFQREVLGGASAVDSTGSDNEYKRFAAATIEAAAVLRKPTGEYDGDEDKEGVAVASPALRKTREEIEDEQRLERQQQEKEEIMQRYEEEVRLQQEGDERVAALRARLARIKESRKRATNVKEKGKETANGSV